MGKSNIEYTDYVWSPIEGCTPVSEGCAHCWARRMQERFHPDGLNFSKVTCYPSRLKEPLHWKTPRKIFVCSRSDIFHPLVPNEFIDDIFEVMSACPQHTFIILTKRPELIAEKLYGYSVANPCRELGGGDYLPNVWLGVTCENQKAADDRIPILLQTPAAKRWVSYEPALESVDFTRLNYKGLLYIDVLNGLCGWPIPHAPIIDAEASALDWIVMGCESGPGARPMDLNWARSVRDQCQAAGIPFFLKQANIDGKLVKMPELDGRVWAEYPR